jgi:cytochrome P450
MEGAAEQKTVHPGLVVPPFPEPAAEDLPTFQFASRMRNNALTGFPRRAYEEAVVRRRFLGRHSLILNDPDAIRHVLVDAHERYGRTPATVRVLRPILGNGLFISEGPAWPFQRRTIAPAFTPKAVGVLVPHILSAAAEALHELEAAARSGPVSMLTMLQHLALEIAGRTMFSLQMRMSGPKLREFIARYGQRLGRPYLLDMLMPANWPSPHDLARFWFRRAWLSYIQEIITERQQMKGADRPRDLLDLLTAARDPETGKAFSPAQLRRSSDHDDAGRARDHSSSAILVRVPSGARAGYSGAGCR